MTSEKLRLGGAPYGVAHESSTSFFSSNGPAINLIKRALARYVRHRSFKAAERELHALDDRMLRDIGISRSEISSALLDAAHERRNGRRPPLG